MKAAAQAIIDIARDPRFVGGTVGVLAVLHTWTQQLTAFFMPPRVDLRLQRFVPEIIGGGTRRRWVRRERQTFGLHLSPYRREGCMFLVGEDGRAERELSLWCLEPARIETLCFAERPAWHASVLN